MTTSEKENSEFKLRLKIDLVPHSACAKGLGKYIYDILANKIHLNLDGHLKK